MSALAPSLYAQLLGAAFERLPPLLQSLHDERPRKRYAGRCTVRRGEGWLARLIARIAALPQAHGDGPVSIEIECDAAGETWVRRFGEHEMRSVLRSRERALEERLGLMALTFELIAEGQRIVWRFKRARVLFLPLPISWFAACTATETIAEERYCFDVRAEIRGVGLIVHYTGWLIEHEPAPGA
jgi:Domain of unknown function (DUF4166)